MFKYSQEYSVLAINGMDYSKKLSLTVKGLRRAQLCLLSAMSVLPVCCSHN